MELAKAGIVSNLFDLQKFADAFYRWNLLSTESKAYLFFTREEIQRSEAGTDRRAGSTPTGMRAGHCCSTMATAPAAATR